MNKRNENLDIDAILNERRKNEKTPRSIDSMTKTAFIIALMKLEGKDIMPSVVFDEQKNRSFYVFSPDLDITEYMNQYYKQKDFISAYNSAFSELRKCNIQNKENNKK